MANNIEYEGRVLDVDGVKMESLLGKARASHIADKDYRRYVFNNLGGDSNKWARLRTDGKSTKLTVKEKVSDGVDGVKEWETKVDDFTTAYTIMLKLGLSPNSYQENRRKLYELEGVKLSIDSWPGLGDILEIEGHSKDDVLSMLDKLGLDESKFTADPIGKLYADRLGIQLANRKELKFGDFK